MFRPNLAAVTLRSLLPLPLIIGIHTGHDGGCAISRDGEILVACAEERLTRLKYANGWWQSLRYCLDATNARLEDADLVVFSNSGEPLHPHFDGGLSRWASPLPRTCSVDHHLSHAIGAFAFSNFNSAIVIVGDAGGNSDVTESVFQMERTGFERLLRSPEGLPRCQGLGTTYEAFTNFLGFTDQESGKTMALAAYGDPAAFQEPIFVTSDRGEVVSRLHATHQWGVQEFAQRNRVALGQPFQETTSARSQNIAAYVQSEFLRALTEVVVTILDRHGTPETPVCLSGGIALNCVANTKLRGLVGPRPFYPFPVSSDCGLAIGNAVYGHWLLEHEIPRPENQSMRFGRTYTDREIALALQRPPDTIQPGRIRLGELRWHRTEDPARDAAQIIAGGGIVAWCQGPSEAGPRALGGRSILADPRASSVREKINQRVKRREWFRPFGPSMLLSEVAPSFGQSHRFPYMIEAPLVEPAASTVFPACIHIDGSARVQTVDEESSTSSFLELLRCIKGQTGSGVVLNTSFNVREPIVESPADAVATFLSSSIDALVLGHYVCFRSVNGRTPSP